MTSGFIFQVILVKYLYFVTCILSDIVDTSGYIVYCPCMGRFGNQAEQFLGALQFAKNLNRTFVVPPWIVYDYNVPERKSNVFIKYSKWFDLEELQKCYPNKVVTLDNFMKKLATKVWPEHERKIYCHKGAMSRTPEKNKCPAKDGNPFKPFWDHHNINFDGGSVMFPEFFSYQSKPKEWNVIFPPNDNPVLAFMGPPASFPIQEQHRGLQECMVWSKDVDEQANKFIRSNIRKPFIALHLRNGMDWVRACEHISSSSNHFMASAQCVGYNVQTADDLTQDMCLPSSDTVLKKTMDVSKKHSIKSLYIATDSDSMKQLFSDNGFKVIQYPEDSVVMDLAIMTMADAFIGNCVSSFSSFVVRYRELQEKPVYLFGYDKKHPPIKKKHRTNLHEEF